jgi:hypothetical protein
VTDHRRGDEGQPSDQRPDVVRSYEVRVEGRLGDALLRYLRWSDRTPPVESVVRVRLSAGGLQRLVASCVDRGLLINRITRVEPQPDSIRLVNDLT